MIDEESELANLYAIPLDQFTAARNDLAARLDAEDNKEAAIRVKRLKKPSVSAWAVNQLARTREIDLARMLKAGEALEKAQQAVLSGKPADFEKARKEEGAAVRVLREAAKEVLPSVSAAILDRIAQTLRAASTAEGRARLKEGRLTEDLEPAGFEAFAGFDAQAAKGSKAASKQPNRKRALLIEKQNETREKLKVAATEVRELEREARATEAAARKAALSAEAAKKRAELLQADLQKIEDDLAKLP